MVVNLGRLTLILQHQALTICSTPRQTSAVKAALASRTSRRVQPSALGILSAVIQRSANICATICLLYFKLVASSSHHGVGEKATPQVSNTRPWPAHPHSRHTLDHSSDLVAARSPKGVVDRRQDLNPLHNRNQLHNPFHSQCLLVGVQNVVLGHRTRNVEMLMHIVVQMKPIVTYVMASGSPSRGLQDPRRRLRHHRLGALRVALGTCQYVDLTLIAMPTKIIVR